MKFLFFSVIRHTRKLQRTIVPSATIVQPHRLTQHHTAVLTTIQAIVRRITEVINMVHKPMETLTVTTNGNNTVQTMAVTANGADIIKYCNRTNGNFLLEKWIRLINSDG